MDRIPLLQENILSHNFVLMTANSLTKKTWCCCRYLTYPLHVFPVAQQQSFHTTFYHHFAILVITDWAKQLFCNIVDCHLVFIIRQLTPKFIYFSIDFLSRLLFAFSLTFVLLLFIGQFNEIFLM